jgi:hypothetical protein
VRSGALLALVAGGGCVYPATEPTGVELSWRFIEQGADEGEAEGESEARIRSCAGAQVEQLAFEIADVDEPRRHGIMRFACAKGYQTTIELQTAASAAFVRLDPGPYAIGVLAIDDASNAQHFERLEEREVEVNERGVTVEIWQLRRAPVAWTLDLRNADACDGVALSLRYAEPEADLPGHDPSQDAPLYRTALASDRGLLVGGQATACTAALGGVHRFEGIDRGEYLLELEVDGRACAVRVDLRGRGEAGSVIDLASLPCDG